jgi:hypothetical protein
MFQYWPKRKYVLLPHIASIFYLTIIIQMNKTDIENEKWNSILNKYILRSLLFSFAARNVQKNVDMKHNVKRKL